MYPKPKPQKGAKKKANEKRKRELTAYRKIQYELAVERDEGGCRFCEKVRASEVNHVWGRGRKAGDWREHFSNLVCTCQSCHPLPIKILPPRDDQMYIVELIKRINNAEDLVDK